MTSYIIPSQKPTVVNGCVSGNFRSEDQLDLIIARTNRLELLQVTCEGLKPSREIPVFGRIAAIRRFKADGFVSRLITSRQGFRPPICCSS